MKTIKKLTITTMPSIQEAQAAYNRYGKPLEREHKGKFVAVSLKGQVLVANSLVKAMKQANDTFGPGGFVFKIGQRAVGEWL